MAINKNSMSYGLNKKMRKKMIYIYEEYLKNPKDKFIQEGSSEFDMEYNQLYGKNLGEDTQLHVHLNFDGLVTGAKIKNLLNSTEVGISNYEATILDLNAGKSWSQKPKASTKW